MGLRSRFWTAFWRRQQKYLPPAAQVAITGANVWVDKEATVPAISVEVGREWRNGERRADSRRRRRVA